MDKLRELVSRASKLYNRNLDHLPATLELIEHSMFLLKENAKYDYFGPFKGKEEIGYYAFFDNNEISRPIRDDLYIRDINNYKKSSNNVLIDLKNINTNWDSDKSNLANKVIYTSIMSIACAFDLWKKGSRKTPGTVFEIYIAALLKVMLPNEIFSKHIPLIDQINSDEELTDPASVSTDIVIKSGANVNRGVVIPLKITTRERIVQPFAQQRILDSYFGNGIFNSFLACISETQQDKTHRKVNHICVPGTIRLYQKYLSNVAGMYYCDIPERYLQADLTDIIPVKSMGEFLLDINNFFMRTAQFAPH
ncbi:type II site-specific deoxyribonuclease [Escherichia albertii]|uniref:type II site-specific deoxyribonuclease n=1 Tax=Escherichia albertii TaxID=208962 RepID=UPI001F1A00A6|nr:type II site-specific deoxyribonuclease [Escherichia albertii]MCZ8867958.1 type II site-specific deoxyribonuclease [Escherichia albertii]MCZ9148677.1 type II site-specific deoxyribonuclease [Escherichia albertii]